MRAGDSEGDVGKSSPHFSANTAECSDTERDVCGEFSPAAIATCIDLGGGADVCASPRWSREFYTYVVSKMKISDQPLHCFAEGKNNSEEICGPFNDNIIKKCLDEGGQNACYGNRWSRVFHDSLAETTSSPTCSTAECFTFPTKNKSTRICEEAGDGIGAFGASRDGGSRKHAGCDLYGNPGDTLYAIADGTLIQQPYLFYCDTDALEVRHGKRVVRYGEIRSKSGVNLDNIRVGQPLARIGKLSCYHQSMLHFELYAGTVTGTLSGGGVFRRRSDLLDPTSFLKAWRAALTGDTK